VGGLEWWRWEATAGGWLPELVKIPSNLAQDRGDGNHPVTAAVKRDRFQIERVLVLRRSRGFISPGPADDLVLFRRECQPNMHARHSECAGDRSRTLHGPFKVFSPKHSLYLVH
jgi:hypothetical protein